MNNTESFKKEFDDLLKKYNLEMNINMTGYHHDQPVINFYRYSKFSDVTWEKVYDVIDIDYGTYYNPNNP